MDRRRTKLREGVQEVGPIPIPLEALLAGSRRLGEARAVPHGTLRGLVLVIGVLRRGEEAHGCGARGASSQWVTRLPLGLVFSVLPLRGRSRGQPGGCAEASNASARVPARRESIPAAAITPPLPKLNRECGCRFTFWALTKARAARASMMGGVLATPPGARRDRTPTSSLVCLSFASRFFPSAKFAQVRGRRAAERRPRALRRRPSRRPRGAARCGGSGAARRTGQPLPASPAAEQRGQVRGRRRLVI